MTMIAYIKGKLVMIQEESVVLDVDGIGYEIICPNPFIYQKYMDQETFIYTYHHVREDVQCLFGFKDEDQKLLFTKLISVSGIGPKSAINMIGTVQVPDFIAAIEQEDEKYLTQFPGVGKKTARQIILDLLAKSTLLYIITEPKKMETTTNTMNEPDLTEVREALQALGYKQDEINSIKPTLKQFELAQTNELIKKALALLVKQ